MKLQAKLIIIGLLLVSGFVRADVADCDAPEMIKGQEKYNQFVCSGVSHMQEEEYKKAVTAFESALAMHLFEIPNFELYPRLAWAYFQAGDIGKAHESLLKAELTLSVFTGLLECKETQDGFYLQSSNGERIASQVSAVVTSRMCGGAYDYIYKHRSFERILQEAELVKRYLDIKQRIGIGSRSLVR